MKMLYQTYGCKERTKHRVGNQTRRQGKNLTIVLTNKKQKVQTIVGGYENVREIEKKMFVVVLTGTSYFQEI